MNTRLLLALAAILITNSHLEKFYPWPLLAGDGLLGNSIFFMVAGLGITLSARNKLRRGESRGSAPGRRFRGTVARDAA